MEFRKYQHIERFGTSEVSGIEEGECYVFPKLDGSNASLWMGDKIQCGSRRRHLIEGEQDNQGFRVWVAEQPKFQRLFEAHPDLRLYGEWLVPHSLKTYRDDAWREFYVFDVTNDLACEHDWEDNQYYMHYDKYSDLLDQFNIKYIPPIAKVIDGDYDTFVKLLDQNDYLVKDGLGVGEGIVIKNYDWRNKYGRQTWAKIVRSEFKEMNQKAFGVRTVKTKATVEQLIAEKYVTEALCQKVLAKITWKRHGFDSKFIPELLNTVYYEIITEEMWNIVKKFKSPTINFSTLTKRVISRVREQLPEVF